MGAVLLPYVWTLDGMAFGDGVTDRYLTEVTGWAARTAPRTNKTPRVAAAGDWAGGSYAGSRTIPFKGCWRTTNRTEASAALDALASLCLSTDPLAEFVLRRTEGVRDRWTYVRLDDELDPIITRGGLIVFDSQLYCPDGRWFSAAPFVWAPTGLQADVGGGLLWNGTAGTSGGGVLWNGTAGTSGGGVEWQQAASVSGGSVVVQNLGNASTPVVFTWAGTGGTGLTNPYVRLESTGDVIQYNGVIPVGSSVTVDTGTTRVLVNGSYAPANVLLRNEFFELPRNSTSTITFGSAGGSDQGLLTGYHYHAYQGG
jgi:hypothetical protein